MFSKFTIQFRDSMNLYGASFKFHRHGGNSKSKFFHFFLDYVNRIRHYHNINIKRSPWSCVYSQSQATAQRIIYFIFIEYFN